MWKMLPEILVVLSLLLTECLFLQVMVKNVCLHVCFSSLMTDRAGFFGFPRATYFPRVRTCTSFKVCHVTRKRTSPCSYVVISANEAYNGGMGAHDLLIVSTFFRPRTCFEVCSHDGLLGEEEMNNLSGDFWRLTCKKTPIIWRWRKIPRPFVLQCQAWAWKSPPLRTSNRKGFAQDFSSSSGERRRLFPVHLLQRRETCCHIVDRSAGL